MGRRDRDTNGECQVKMDVDTGVTHLQTKAYQTLPVIVRSWKKSMEQIIPQTPQTEPSLTTL